jgi:hypothetical protein
LSVECDNGQWAASVKLEGNMISHNVKQGHVHVQENVASEITFLASLHSTVTAISDVL